MKFQEIIKETGMYRADSFSKGVCIIVEKDKIWGGDNTVFKLVGYKNENDMMPETFCHSLLCNSRIFEKEYTKVFTRQALFKS